MKKLIKKKPFKKDIIKWHWKNKYNVSGFDYCIIADTSKHITKNQVESCRKIISRISRRFKPRPQFKFKLNYSMVCTKKSIGSRMGRGKGNVKCFVAKINKNDILFIFKKCNVIFVKSVLNRIKYKLPIKLKILYNFSNGYSRYEDIIRR